MQPKSDKFSEFSERTESLAAHLGKKLSELPEVIGISPAMFFAYRSGKNTVSGKAWRKLEKAEREAGIGPELHDALVAVGIIKEGQGLYRGSSDQDRNRRIAAELRRLADELDPPL